MLTVICSFILSISISKLASLLVVGYAADVTAVAFLRRHYYHRRHRCSFTLRPTLCVSQSKVVLCSLTAAAAASGCKNI